MANPATMMQIAQIAAPLVQDYLGANKTSKNAKAYQDYLNNFSGGIADTLQNRATEYEGKLGDMASSAETQYMNEANTPLAELTQMKSDISNESAEAQRQNRLQIQNQLNASGVRGGQASILQNRATGELNRNLQRDINALGYNEASNRQNSRLGYLSNKAYNPWANLSGTYGANAQSASSALSGAQGNSLANAYNLALGNYKNTLSNPNYSKLDLSKLSGL